MEYIKRKINLENYVIRSIPKSVIVTNDKGKDIIDVSNSKYFYGTIPDYLAKIINHFRSYSRNFWGTDCPILFLVLVVVDCTRYVHKINQRKVCANFEQ